MEKQNEVKIISGGSYGAERALYGIRSALVQNCIFAGEEDGESALKECRDVTVRNCRFSLRYPMWHDRGLSVYDCMLDSGVRAPLWYTENAKFEHCTAHGVKCMRECGNIVWKDCDIVSAEFGWKCDDVNIENCDITSEYFMFESARVTVDRLRFHGKYSFQYTENMTVENSELDTKDAFWHSKNVTVKNCKVKGEYLGWYSENLTLINCQISGTQPLCYCRGLKLINCTMEGCDLAFEYSDVEADIRGTVLSVKNPLSGSILADGYGSIIWEDSVMETSCSVNVRGFVPSIPGKDRKNEIS